MKPAQAPQGQAGQVQAGDFAGSDHSRIAALIYREAGIVLGPEKVGMMDARLTRRVRATGSADLADYVRRLDSGALPDETAHLISALTTNFTHFFREAHHFDFLRDVVFPDPAAALRPLRIWSAGCSSGQEPYSAAITARQANRRVDILATDIDAEILARAAAASYLDREVSGMAPELLDFAFLRSDAGWTVRQPIRDLVRFKQMNLHTPWHFSAPSDVILCRNVIIYFDAESQGRLWEKFCRQLRPGGWLLIGHSERVPDHLRQHLRPIRHTIYQYDPA